MRFTTALALSAITFLGASAAPNSPPSYAPDTSSASSGTTNPGTGDNAPSNPPANPPTTGAPPSTGGCSGGAQSVCCNTVEGAKTIEQQLPQSGIPILSGILGNVLGNVELNGLLSCGLSGVLGNGNCNHQTICCTAINSPVSIQAMHQTEV